MGSKWRKVKLALGMNMCVYTPINNVADNDDEGGSLPPFSYRHSDAALLSPVANWTSAPPTPGSNMLKFSKSLSRSSSKKKLQQAVEWTIKHSSVFRGKEAHLQDGTKKKVKAHAICYSPKLQNGSTSLRGQGQHSNQYTFMSIAQSDVNRSTTQSRLKLHFIFLW